MTKMVVSDAEGKNEFAREKGVDRAILIFVNNIYDVIYWEMCI